MAVGAIVLVAIAVRLYHLGTESVWTDEAHSIAMARLPARDIVSLTAAEDTTPPLYYLVLHGWQRVFGDSPSAARMPSAIAGTLAVVFAYLAAAPLLGRFGGVTAALIHALSPFLVAYSQEARQYAFLSCSALASFAFLIRLLNGKRFATAGYICATALLCYTHSVGLFVLLGQMVYVAGATLLTRTARRQRALIAQALALAAYLPWAIVALRQYRQLGGVFWVPVPTLFSVVQTFYEYMPSTSLAEICLLLAVLGFVQVTPLASTGPSRNIIRALEERVWSVRLADLNASWLLFCWLAVPIAALFLISRVGPSLYLTRATIAASSAFYLLVARGLTQLRGLSRIVGVAAVSVLLCAEVADYFGSVKKEQWHAMVADVSVLVHPGDVFVFHQRSRQKAFDYYFRGDTVRRVGFPNRPLRATDVITEMDVQTLPSVVDERARVWLVLVASKDTHGMLRDALRRTRREFFHRRYVGIEVYGFDKPHPRAS